MFWKMSPLTSGDREKSSRKLRLLACATTPLHHLDLDITIPKLTLFVVGHFI